MTFRQFVIYNVRRNPKVYGPYFFSSFFAVVMFFVYALLIFHPEFSGGISAVTQGMGQVATIGFQISQVIIVIFSSFAIFYAVSSFLKMRKYEFGILLTQGISKRQLIRLIFLENCLTGFAAILFGILFGFVFSKVILLACSNLLALEKTLPFYFPWKPVTITFIVFGLMFVFISFLTSLTVRTNNIRTLIDARRAPKKAIKKSGYLSCMSFLLIVSGYAVVLVISERSIRFSFLSLFTGVILVVIGTYFLFSQLLIFLLQLCRKKEAVYFHRTNLLILSELVYRMRDNVSTFFIVAIISATAITAVGTSTAIGSSSLAGDISSPYAMTYSSDKPISPKLIQKAENSLQGSGVKNYRQATGTFYYFWPADKKVLKLHDYNRLLALTGEPPVKLKENETILVPYTEAEEKKLMSDQGEQSVTIPVQKKQHSYSIKSIAPLNRFPQLNFSSADHNPFVIIVSDDSVNSLLKMAKSTEATNVYYAVFHSKNWENTAPAARNLEKGFNSITGMNVTKGGFLTFDSLALNWQRIKQVDGLLLLLTVLCGIVFYTFSAGFIYLRLYNDQKRDETQYQMLYKIGLKKSELKKIISIELLFLFFIPLIVAVLHSAVAFIALHNLIHFSIASNVAIIIGVFMLAQIIYYFIVRHRYLHSLYKAIKA